MFDPICVSQLLCFAVSSLLLNQSARLQEKWMRTEWHSIWAKKAVGRPATFRFEPPLPEISVGTSPAAYYAVPFMIWHPCRMFPADVPHAPCPGPKSKSEDSLGSSEEAAIDAAEAKGGGGRSGFRPCLLQTTLKSFNSPRWVIGVSRSELLWTSSHHCPEHGAFSSSDERSMSRLPTFIQNMFPYVCSSRSAITRE